MCLPKLFISQPPSHLTFRSPLTILWPVPTPNPKLLVEVAPDKGSPTTWVIICVRRRHTCVDVCLPGGWQCSFIVWRWRGWTARQRRQLTAVIEWSLVDPINSSDIHWWTLTSFHFVLLFYSIKWNIPLGMPTPDPANLGSPTTLKWNIAGSPAIGSPTSLGWGYPPGWVTLCGC